MKLKDKCQKCGRTHHKAISCDYLVEGEIRAKDCVYTENPKESLLKEQEKAKDGDKKIP